MQQTDAIPYESAAQREQAAQWSALVGTRRTASTLLAARGVRDVVRTSWQRSLAARIRPDLDAAPVVLDESAVHDATVHTDWYGVASEAIARHRTMRAGDGHILTLFDQEARMLSAEGDAAALEGLAEINFRPGGDWSERAVGTNGPGTALATGLATHIVGAEHFVERWHRWHCAAVPLKDPATGRIAGVLDLSGFRESAHPHTLNLAIALGVAIEQTLTAREYERRFAILQSFQQLSSRYAGDGVIAVDRGGHVLAFTPSVAPPVVDALAVLVRHANGCLSKENAVPVAIGDRKAATWYPVLQGQQVVGGCFVLDGAALPSGSEGIPFKPGEVRVYARRFFEAGARDLGRLSPMVAPAVYDAMQAYHWPGNVRELKNVIRRMLQLTTGEIRVEHLPHAIREAYAGTVDVHTSAIDAEDARLIEVVQRAATMAEAAAELGITRSTLYRRMERFGLKPGRVVRRD